MQGLLARLNAQKNQGSLSKGASRSTSIASSVDDLNDDDRQSNSDESQNQQTSNVRKPKVKRDREKDNKDKDKNNDKKPGWNTVPSAKSRIDTNMVKLKLLDATRKAVLDKTKKPVTSTGMQTDTIKTKLCKDKLTDNQNDLINPKDEATETDLDLIALKSKDGTVIVTASVSVNTEKLVSHTVSTQTVMPRSNVSFKKFTDSRHRIQYAEEDSEVDDDDEEAEMCLEKIERRLKAKKKFSRQKSTQKSNIEIVIEDDSSDIIAIETIPAELPNKNKTSDSEYEDSIQGDYDDKSSSKTKKSKESTFNSWNDLDFEAQKVELPRNYFIESGPTPWSNFESLVLGQRFLNARLSPVPERISRPKVTWSDTQIKVVNDLMSEATALFALFDQVAMLLGPDIKLHNISDVEEFELPASKYNEELTKSCEKLEASLKRLQSPHYLPKSS
ncbi:unnamed protein product [Chironomus riparius]|uniref:Uncharacterized protein n=1 Tax=Chironomus riparius TaxID=315576 RepID=A0A9P0J5U2_9DIPT|nr:unnamed protein product [Chironomus riparius]